MKRFRRILVGVDLGSPDRLVAPELGTPSRCAVDHATRLAAESGASLRFAYVLDVSAAAERLIEERRGEARNVFDAANDALAGLIAEAGEQGVEATSHVMVGRSWFRLLQEIAGGGHDLVVVGTRDANPLQRIQIGSTAMKLLRKCPCPVWVTKPGPESPSSILVAHDLTEVGSRALELGASMASLHGSKLHVLHAIEHSLLHSWFSELISAEEVVSRRREARERIETEMETVEPGREFTLHLSDEQPAYAVSAAIDELGVDLVVMGTVARTGVHGFITGNTAERLLPVLPCSVLAVKPYDFVSPVQVPD